MSPACYRAAWAKRGLWASDRLVLLALCQLATAEGHTVRAGQRYLARLTGLNVATVTAALRRLEAAGCFTRWQAGQSPTEYTLTL